MEVRTFAIFFQEFGRVDNIIKINFDKTLCPSFSSGRAQAAKGHITARKSSFWIIDVVEVHYFLLNFFLARTFSSVTSVVQLEGTELTKCSFSSKILCGNIILLMLIWFDYVSAFENSNIFIIGIKFWRIFFSYKQV